MLEDTEVASVEFVPGIALHPMYESQETPPRTRPPGHGAFLPTRIAPGLAQWHIVKYAPSVDVHVHHTDTLDFDVVLSGRIELLLDDGAHGLGPGDCVVVTGVDHAWRTGSEACELSVISIGTPPLS